MKNLYTLLFSLFIGSCFAQEISVSLETELPGDGSEIVKVFYTAVNGSFNMADTDDWGGQVITLGFTPQTGVMAEQPSSQVSAFTAGYMPFTNAIGPAGNSIFTFVPMDIGGVNDGNVYMSVAINGSTIDKPFVEGVKTEVFSFRLPEAIGNGDDTDMIFLSETDLGQGGVNVSPTIINNSDAENKWDQSPAAISLPITLKSFTAEQYSKNASLLNWTSTSEINASYYEVQRSTDRLVWDVVGQVKTKGSEFVGADYELIDSNLPLAGRTNDVIYYYRLKMVDLDGAFELSEVEAVSFDGLDRGALFVYPNPTVQEVFVTIDNVETLGGSVALLDRSGKTVLTQQLRTGVDERVSLRDLPSGLYHLAVSQAGELFTEKVIKID